MSGEIAVGITNMVLIIFLGVELILFLAQIQKTLLEIQDALKKEKE